MIRIQWSNGTVDEAPDWQALLDHVRATQWRTYDEPAFRQAMGLRAARWSGIKINVDGPPEYFFEELRYAKLIVILKADEVPS